MDALMSFQKKKRQLDWPSDAELLGVREVVTVINQARKIYIFRLDRALFLPLYLLTVWLTIRSERQSHKEKICPDCLTTFDHTTHKKKWAHVLNSG